MKCTSMPYGSDTRAPRVRHPWAIDIHSPIRLFSHLLVGYSPRLFAEDNPTPLEESIYNKMGWTPLVWNPAQIDICITVSCFTSQEHSL